MTTTTVTVKGMTCDHCVNAVRSEIDKIDGVSGVEVDLDSGLVTIESSGPVTSQSITAAVDEAGFEVVGAPTEST